MSVRAELLFTIKLKRRNGEAFEIPLVFLSAFERVQPESDNEMHKMGNVIRLYEPGPLPVHEPIIYVGFLSHVLCIVPQIPCYMGGSKHPTVSHRFARSSKVLFGRADRHVGTGDGSKLYNINMWIWKSGRGMTQATSRVENLSLLQVYKKNRPSTFS